jgi:putative oxidoreductase
VAAFGISVNMLVAVLMVHSQFGFFANWSGTQKGEGYECHLLAFAMCAFLMTKGAGAFSVDRKMSLAGRS